MSLSSVQEQVLAALAAGSTQAEAAELASIHRNTIAYWRRTSFDFREALTDALYDKALSVREQAESRATASLETLDALMADPKTPAGVRVKIALHFLNTAANPPLPRHETLYTFQSTTVRNPEAAHSNAQSVAQNDAQNAPSEAAHHPEPKPQIVHSPAQIHNLNKTGRNEPCPCGSGLKFKRCCLNKPRAQAA